MGGILRETSVFKMTHLHAHGQHRERPSPCRKVWHMGRKRDETDFGPLCKG
jgi:hypothetical protein